MGLHEFPTEHNRFGLYCLLQTKEVEIRVADFHLLSGISLSAGDHLIGVLAERDAICCYWYCLMSGLKFLAKGTSVKVYLYSLPSCI